MFRAVLSCSCQVAALLLIRGLSAQAIPPTQTPDLHQGRVLYQQQQFEAAIVAWERALESGTNSKAMVLNHLSLAYQQTGQWSKAMDAIAQSLKLLQSADPPQPHLYAQALNTQGRLQLALGRPDQALIHWEQATEQYQQLEDRTGIAGTLINQAQALEALGLYRRACKTLLQAVQLPPDCDLSTAAQWQQVREQFAGQPNPRLKLLGLRNLGNSLRLMGQLDSAESILKTSLDASQTPADQGATFLSLGKLERSRYQQIRDLGSQIGSNSVPEAALTHVQQAMAYWQRAAETRGRLAQLNQLSLWVELQQDTARQPRSGDYAPQQIQAQIQQQVTMLRGLDRQAASYDTASAQLHFAQSLIQLGPQQRSLALTMAKTALAQAQDQRNTRLTSHALGLLGRIYEQAEQWPEAQRLSEQALLKAQTIRATDLAGQWQWQLGRILQAQNQRPAALNAYQAAVSTVTSHRKNLLALGGDVQSSFQADVEPVYRQFVNLLLQSPDVQDSQRLKQAMEVIDTWQRVELENFLRCDLTSLVSLAQQPLASNAALIYPIILADRIEVIVRLPSGAPIQRYTTPIPRQTVETTLAHLRFELEKNYISKDVHRLSQEIYRWILQPAEAALTQHQVKTLVFVLDSSFRDVPMAALHDGDQYLVEKGYAVALVPGLQLVPSRSLGIEKLRALTFGLSEPPPEAGQIPPLPQVEEELAQIRAYLPTRQRINQAFTQAELQRQLQTASYSVVHIATHGQFSSDPNQTYLQTWNQKLKGSQLSSILQDRFPQGLQPIELLVLSACTTAVGDNRAILGLAGLAVQSGARSTVASLWSISDRSTAKLMRHFYRTLTAGQVTKAEALRQAQVQLLQTPGYQAPRFWAPFILVGDWQ